MAGLLIVPGLWPVFDANGDPISGATINFYEPGTTTPKAVYSSSTLATSLGTSLTTNAGGEPTTLAGTIARLWWAADAGVYDVQVIAGASTRTWSGVAVSDSAVMSRLVYDADYATLALAVSDAISRGQSLYITQDHTISTNTTIACPVIVDGGSFSVNEFRTLTFTRGLDAGWEQIFFGLGLVTGLRDVAAEWWGAKSDDTGDASVGWNKANACRMSAALSGTTVGEWRHRLNERGTYRFMSTAELHVSATAGLTMRGGGPIFQTILKAGSGSSGTILLKITAPLSGLDKIVTFDIGGFSVVEEAGTSMICGLQVGDTVTGSYGDKTYALKGVTYSKISNVQSNGFTNGFKNVNSSFIEYDNCTAWNQSNEAFIGFWDYADRAGAVGFINYNNCYVAGSFGDITRIGHLTDSTSGGYATRIIGTVVMEDSGYQRFMKYAAGGALANIEVGAASELDGDLDPLTSARGVFVQCEDLLAYAGPASSCRNIIINGIWCAGHNDAAVTFKTVKAGSMRDIKILNSAIANHTGNAILIDGPIDGVIINNVSFQECSSAGPLVWLTNGVTKAIVDNVTLTQPTPALTVLSMVQIDSTCDNVSVGNIIANEANCTAGLIVDNTPNTARKSIVGFRSGFVHHGANSTGFNFVVGGRSGFQVADVGTVFPTPDVNGQSWWSTDTPRGQDAYLEGRMFAGAAATYPGIATQTPSAGWLQDWMVRDASIVSANPHGGTAGSFHTRNGDTLRPPLTGLASTVAPWAAGQSISIGNQRGWDGIVYSATNSGTTAAPPPTHFSGTSPDGGGVSWSVVTTRGVYFTTIGVLSRARSEISDGQSTWCHYIEGIREAAGDVVFGMEIGMKNKGSNVVLDSFEFLKGGSTIGGWYAAGADSAYDGAPTAPTTAHIVMARNSTTANTGILFAHNAFEVIDGKQRAIGLGPTQAIQWWAAAGRIAFEVRSDGAAAGRELRIEQVGSGAALDFSSRLTTNASEILYRFIQPDLSAPGSRANYIQFLTGYAGGGGTGTAVMQGEGPDTNIDVVLQPKGTGVVRFQVSSTAAATPASFSAARYIPFRDLSGTLYYIPLATATW